MDLNYSRCFYILYCKNKNIIRSTFTMQPTYIFWTYVHGKYFRRLSWDDIFLGELLSRWVSTSLYRISRTRAIQCDCDTHVQCINYPLYALFNFSIHKHLFHRGTTSKKCSFEYFSKTYSTTHTFLQYKIFL